MITMADLNKIKNGHLRNVVIVLKTSTWLENPPICI